MSLTAQYRRRPGRGVLAKGIAFACLMLGGLTGCPPDTLVEQMMPTIEDLLAPVHLRRILNPRRGGKEAS